MPPLANVQHAPIVSPSAPVGNFGQRPFGWPGYPDDGRLTAREAIWLGHVFGIDTPYYATPSGWGEWIPLDRGTQGVLDVLVFTAEGDLLDQTQWPTEGSFPAESTFP